MAITITDEQRAVLDFKVREGADAWIKNSTQANMEAKVAKYKQDYLDAKASEGADYKTAKEKKESHEAAEKTKWETRGYAQKRREEYPIIGDQLDMLWHALDDGTLDKTSDFYTSLKATKDKYPKT